MPRNDDVPLAETVASALIALGGVWGVLSSSTALVAVCVASIAAIACVRSYARTIA